nr:cobalamin biosynthesis protein [Desulfitobacterium metallireducens]
MIVLTNQAWTMGEKIMRSFQEYEVSPEMMELWIHQKCLTSKPDCLLEAEEPHTFERLADILPELWKKSVLLIFVMATGIVVRQIAPLIQSKDRDPAVLVLDEKGQFVISLLSGHLGGANAWAKALADQIKAKPVITTATDVQGLIAPDEYARRLGWAVKPVSGLKHANRCLLDTGCLKVWLEIGLSLEHTLKKDEHYIFVDEDEKESAQIWVTPFHKSHSNGNLPWITFVPKALSVGVGSRRGISKENVLEAIQESLSIIGASEQSVSGIFSIDLKQQEAGIIEAAYEMGVPFQTFSATEIQTLVEQRRLSQSEFVKEKIGVDGVCEAASLLGTRHGELILPKQKQSGVTVAISMERFLS